MDLPGSVENVSLLQYVLPTVGHCASLACREEQFLDQLCDAVECHDPLDVELVVQPLPCYLELFEAVDASAPPLEPALAATAQAAAARHEG